MPIWVILLILVLVFGAGPVLYGLGIVFLWILAIPLVVLLLVIIAAVALSD